MLNPATHSTDTLGAALTAMLIGHIDSHRTGGVDSKPWPNDAMYYVEYRLKAWPTSYSHHSRFFPDSFALTRWYDSQIEWTRSEDNYFVLDRLYLWDLGPVHVTDTLVHINAR